MKSIITKKGIVVAVLVLLLTGIFSFKTFDDGDDFEIAKNLDIYHSVIRDIRLLYVEDVDFGKLIKESIEEFLEKLDPYTVYYPESMIEEYTFMSTGAYGGVGAMIIEDNDKLIISEVYKDGPADKAGVIIGDVICEIEGKTVNKKNIDDLKKLIKGEPGKAVSIKVKRYDSDKLIEKVITRKKIQVNNIEHYSLFDKDIAYIKLQNFRRGAASDLKKAFIELRDSVDLQGVIIDLRGNPGGLLMEAVKIVNLFVEKGNVVVSTKGKVSKWNNTFKTTAEPIAPELPVVVLVNQNSASASEIVSGAIQDLDRGVVIGQRTYGKGLVQITRDLSYNTKIKITTAKYYIPSGRCIQALDYSHKKADGKAGKIPDSLISEFQTSNGRKVYDGCGILPDIVMKSKYSSHIISNLVNNLTIFNFAVKFKKDNPVISSAEKFTINDKQFKDFVDFALKDRNDYTSETSIVINELINTAKEEEYNQNILNKIKELKSDLMPNKEDYYAYKEEVIQILNGEISLNYFYSKGRLISMLNSDNSIKKAIEILKNKQKYNNILGYTN